MPLGIYKRPVIELEHAARFGRSLPPKVINSLDNDIPSASRYFPGLIGYMLEFCQRVEMLADRPLL